MTVNENCIDYMYAALTRSHSPQIYVMMIGVVCSSAVHATTRPCADIVLQRM